MRLRTTCLKRLSTVRGDFARRKFPLKRKSGYWEAQHEAHFFSQHKKMLMPMPPLVRCRRTVTSWETVHIIPGLIHELFHSVPPPLQHPQKPSPSLVKAWRAKEPANLKGDGIDQLEVVPSTQSNRCRLFTITTVLAPPSGLHHLSRTPDVGVGVWVLGVSASGWNEATGMVTYQARSGGKMLNHEIGVRGPLGGSGTTN